MVRRAQQGFAETRAPLLGVMGAFVFAAQMINFPVGVGTSGHLVGGALLAYTLGPSAAAVVMTAILAIQALVFQDGGVLAFGANVLNMAIAGVVAAYGIFHLAGAGRWRRLAIFAGGTLSVLVSALLALAELAASGVPMPGAVLGVSLLLFLVSATIEGAITLVVLDALETVQPRFIYTPAPRRAWGLILTGVAAVLLAGVGVMFASTHPDGIEKLAQQLGIASHTRTLIQAPLADYELGAATSPWLRKSAAGLAGLLAVYSVSIVLARFVRRKGNG
jgi:cobalt/nickel transport system permease protein